MGAYLYFVSNAHKPFAERQVKMMLIEPRGVKNTGREEGERTAPNDVRV
jgi:hypothetical protein